MMRCRFKSCCPPNFKPNNMETLEKKVADAILERASDSITIDGNEYPIAPPSPATLILVSELVSTMPIVKKDAENALYEVLSTAKDLSVIGKIVATLMLGAKRIKEHRKVAIVNTEHSRKWSWRKLRFVMQNTTKEVEELDYLSEKILEEVTPATLLKVVINRIGNMQVMDFFELTTSLSAANLLKRTKEVETTSGD